MHEAGTYLRHTKNDFNNRIRGTRNEDRNGYGFGYSTENFHDYNNIVIAKANAKTNYTFIIPIQTPVGVMLQTRTNSTRIFIISMGGRKKTYSEQSCGKTGIPY